jgi:hypothetical protein
MKFPTSSKATSMKQNPLLLAGTIAASLFILQTAIADNLATNGNISTDATGWGTRLIKLPGTDGATTKEIDNLADKDQRFITYVPDDGAEGSKGCLKIDMEVNDDYSTHPSEVGIYARIQKIPGSEASPARAKVTFFAKSPDSAVAFLRVGRLGAGAGSKIVPLTPDWEKFEVAFGAPHPIGGVLFSPSDKHGNKIVPGPVLIDEVVVEDVSGQPVEATAQ